MKTFKKFLCTFLVVVMCLTSAPLQGFVGMEWPEINFGNFKLPEIDFGEWFGSKASALAANGQCGDNVYWTYDRATGKLVISGTGAMYNYNSIHIVSPFCYSDIRTIVIEYGVTTIGDQTFPLCFNLTSVTIPNSVTTIGHNAFSGCESLTSITIPDSVTTIGEGAFGSCGNLTGITIPDSVTTISEMAFAYCERLTSITVDENNTAYSSDSNGVLFNKNKTLLVQYPIGNVNTSYKIPDSVITIGEAAFSNCSSLTSVTIPDSATSIGDITFYDCTNLTKVTIGKSVRTIGESAFGSCGNLTGITIPDSVTKIDSGAFSSCSSLTSITIPASVTTLGGAAFSNCSSLTSATIPDSVTSIDNCTFYDCTKLVKVTLGNSIKRIGYEAFWNCSSLTSVTIPDSVTTIGEGAFSNCSSLISITIPDSVTTLGNWSFSRCSSLTNITIGNSVTAIEEEAFYNCSNLTSITIPNSVTTIGHNAFYGCESLTSITIPASVTSISYAAFASCHNLTSITVDKNNTAYSNDNRGVLFDKNKTHLILYPRGNTNTSYSIPDSVTTIGQIAFSKCNSLTSITIPDSVTTMQSYVFSNCINLAKVTIGNSVTRISDETFKDCSSLKSVTIGKSVTTIGYDVFYNCKSLTSITVEKNNTVYSSDNRGVLFDKNKTLLILYPRGNTNTSYSIPNSVTKIDSRAFSSCSSLTSVIIPDSVTTIDLAAFASSYSLTSITIPDSVTTIGNNAFYNCKSLTDVYYKGTEEQWNSINISNNNQYLTNATIHYNSSGPVPKIDELEIFALQLLTDELNRFGVGPLTHYYDGITTKPFKNKLISQILDSKVSTKQTDYEYKTIGGNEMNEDGFALTGTSKDLYEQCLFNSDGSNKWRIAELYRNEDTGFFAIAYNQIDTDVTVFSIGASNGLGDNYDVVQIVRVLYNLSVLLYYGETPIVGSLIQKICTSEIQKALHSIFGNDWGNNDFPLYASNIGGTQIPYALKVFDEYKSGLGSDRNIILTGHSLGAALSIMLSNRYKVPATVFDSIPMLDVSYYRYYTEMGENFTGCDNWNFVDIMDNEDVLAGSWEKQYKNYIAVNGTTAKPTDKISKDKVKEILKDIVFASSGLGVPANITSLYLLANSKEVAEICEIVDYVYPVFLGHDPRAMLIQDKNGNYSFADEFDKNEVNSVVKPMGLQTLEYTSSSSGHEEFVRLFLKESLTVATSVMNKHLANDMLMLGSSKDENIYVDPKNEGNDVAYGGNGDDSIITDDGDDVIIGGRGNDDLYGGYGDDRYIYYKGDGVDYISDFAGNDTISLFGFNKNDKITVETANDGCKHICVSGELIMKVAMYRSGNMTNSIEVEICDKNGNSTASKKIQDWNSWKSKKIVVACPVYIEILNPQGEVVLTLENKETELIENEYGVFYVKQVSDGEFAKYIYLYDESYTVRVVGEDDGTMSYTETTIDENGVKHISSADEIEITSETVITSSTDGTVLNYLKDSGADLTEIPLQKTNEVPIESIELNKEEITLCIDNTFDLITTVNPIDATINDMIYYSTNPAIATVDSNGKIIAKTIGTTEIIIDFGVKEVKCNVTVTDHNYEAVVTPATCYSNGFTTNTCTKCGNGYTSDITAMLTHNFSGWYIVTPATCEASGVEQRDCLACDYSETQNVPATGHNYNNGVCTSCGDDLTANCSCNCHAGGLKGLIFKIILFFQKLFRLNRICEGCGVRHY